MNIESNSIATNPYAVGDAQNVRLYSYNGCDNLTIGQLVNVVCCKVGVSLENQSVNKTNVITRNSRRLQGMSEVLEGIMNGNGYDTKMSLSGYTNTTYKDFLVNVCGLTISDTDDNLPTTLSGTNDRIKVYTAMRAKIESGTITSQQDMVDLQTCISRRDVAYTTCTNVVRALGTALQGTSSNF